MSTANATELFLGCQSQIRVVVIEDGGNLVLQVYATDPSVTDIDALFFNLTDDTISADLTIFPAINIENVTGFDVATGTLNQMNNGAQIQDSYDVRIEFGTLSDTSQGDVDEAAFTLYVEGDRPLTAADIDLTNMTAVINSDGGMGLAVTGGIGGAATQSPVLVTALTEDFDGIHAPDDSAAIVSDDHWAIRNDALFTNGHEDGTLTFESVATEGPAEFSFDARAHNVHEFEASGRYADSLRVEVQIDGGDWVLLDEFIVNDDGTALVGSETGQTITADNGTITYSGGALADAGESVQFRLVSDISAGNEQIVIDNVEIRATELVTTGETETVTTENIVATETFDSGSNTSAEHAALVEGHTHWDMRHGELQTDGHDDGRITFDEVQMDGPAAISIDARVPHAANFEASGHYADSLELWVLIDGSEPVLLDTFVVNAEGTALVGDTTGQMITANGNTLTYEGGALDNAGSVQFYMISDISAGNEDIYFDNLTITETVTEEVPVGARCEDFEDAQTGDVVSDQFGGFTVTGQRAGDAANSENDAMIFDTANPTGGDHDLAYANQGKAIIISEDNDSDDPDDNAHGGTLTFEFDEVSDVTSLTLLDVEESGGTIDLYDADGALLNSVAIPAGDNNGLQVVEVNTDGVASMDVTLAGSGAVDDVCFVPAADTSAVCGEYEVTYDDLMQQNTDQYAEVEDTTEQQDESAELML